MIEQIAIALFGLSAIWLSQAPSDAHRKWAPILGLMSQPFWFYATLAAEQYGIFVLSLFYTLAWCRGIRTHWFQPSEEPFAKNHWADKPVLRDLMWFRVLPHQFGQWLRERKHRD